MTRAVAVWRVCRPRMFIQRETVLNMVLAVGRGWEELTFAMLFATAYTFLLRVPSEGLPMRRGGDGYTPVDNEQSLLFLEGGQCALPSLGHAQEPAQGRHSEVPLSRHAGGCAPCQLLSGVRATAVSAAAHYAQFMGCGTDSFRICHRVPSRGLASHSSSCGHG